MLEETKTTPNSLTDPTSHWSRRGRLFAAAFLLVASLGACAGDQAGDVDDIDTRPDVDAPAGLEDDTRPEEDGSEGNEP